MNWLLPTRRYPWTAPLLVLVAAIAIVSYTEFRRERRMKSLEQGASANDVSAALWQLLDAQRIEPEVFTCPATQPTKWDFGGGTDTALNWSNWNGATTRATRMSYRYVNPFDRSSATTTWEVIIAK